jgi:GTPase
MKKSKQTSHNASLRKVSDQKAEPFRSGFVALVGRPNVGKSTLLNAMVGCDVAIATHRPQTTRSRIRGILHQKNSQIIFVDTPGIHKRPQALNRYMLMETEAAISEVDLVVLLVEARGRGSSPNAEPEDQLVQDSLRKSGRRAILAINKIDLLQDKSELLPILDAYARTEQFEEMIPISARGEDGLDRLLLAIESRLPVGPKYFPEDEWTDRSLRDLVSELIRGQVILQCDQEIPYCCAVEIIEFDETSREDLVSISAILYVERDSQKRILIGKGASRLKEIGTGARKAIEKLIGRHVFLDLRVKVAGRWSSSEDGLRKVGVCKS